MRIKFKRVTEKGVVSRLKKRARVRKKVKGSGERPRLAVFRSARHIYAQIIDDVTGSTLVYVSSQKSEGSLSGKAAATWVGQQVAEQAVAKNIRTVVFDRGGYLYHGRVKAVADGAREKGLNF